MQVFSRGLELIKMKKMKRNYARPVTRFASPSAAVYLRLEFMKILGEAEGKAKRTRMSNSR